MRGGIVRYLVALNNIDPLSAGSSIVAGRKGAKNLHSAARGSSRDGDRTMQVGIVGLPLSGKTTLFNALTGQNLETGGFSGRESVNIGTSRVTDSRLDELHAIFEPSKGSDRLRWVRGRASP